MMLINTLAHLSIPYAQTVAIVRHFRVYQSLFKIKTAKGSIGINYTAEYDEIFKNDEISDTAWINLRNSINQKIQKAQSITDSFIIRKCIASKNINALISYINFLRRHDHDIHFGVLLKYLRQVVNIGYDTLNYDEREILDVTEELLRSQFSLDAEVLIVCICALCLTQKWRKAYELFEERYKPSHAPSVKLYSRIVWAAFRNHDSDIAWKYLHEMASFSIEPLNFVHVAYLDYCLAKQLPYKDSIRDMLLYLKSTHFKIYTCYINNYIDVYQNIGHAKYTSINARGMCKVCLNQLDSINLTDKDYQILLDTLVNEILGSNIYSKSTPKEWNNYIKFIKKNKPYDLIIDGLNTHFTIHNINNAVQIIANKFASKGKKVLILGRKHMNMFLKYQSEKVDVILVDNYTDDDLYALYAALSSGRQAGLVTLDLMRSHIYNIKDHAKKDLFMKWFVAHQYTPYKIAGKIIVKPPKRISTSIQQQGNYWHVPVYDTNKISGLCMFPHTWVCMKL